MTTPTILPHIPVDEREELRTEQQGAMAAFCAACKQCGGIVDSFPDCLGDGDYSPSGHMPCCDRCIRAYKLVIEVYDEE